MTTKVSKVGVADNSVGISQLDTQVRDLVLGSVTPLSGTFSATMAGDNQTVATYSSTFTDTVDRHYAVLDGSTPTLSTDGVAGPVLGTIDLVDYLAKSLTLWTYVISTGIWTQRVPSGSSVVGGFSIQANPTSPPVAITDFVASLGSPSTSTLTITYSTTTIIDGLFLKYDLVDVASNGDVLSVLKTDVLPSDTITGLIPGKRYNLEIRVFPSSNASRVSFSNLQTVTMAATVLLITALTITDIGAASAPYNARVTVLSTVGSPDQWIYQIGDSTAPTQGDPGWATLPDLSTAVIDLLTLGTKTVFVWVRNSADPSNISPRAQDIVTATDSGTTTTAVLSFDITDIVVYSENAPTVNIPVTRSAYMTGVHTCDVAITLAGVIGSKAFEDVHYKTVAQQVLFADGVGSVNVPMDLLDNFEKSLSGNNPSVRRIGLILSNPSSGAILGGQNTIIVNITGTSGYLSTGDIDPNNPPTDLVAEAPSTMAGTNAESKTFTYNDATGVDNNLVIAEGATNKTIENNIFANALRHAIRGFGAQGIKIRNNVFLEYNQNNDGSDAIFFTEDVPSTFTQNISILANRFVAAGPAVAMHWQNSMAGFELENNYHEDLLGVRGLIAATLADGANTLVILWGCYDIRSYSIKWNKNINEKGYRNLRDVINLGDGHVFSEGFRGFVECNIIVGTSNPDNNGGDSGTGLIADGIVAGGFIQAQHNIFIETGQSALAGSGGDSISFRQNDCYQPDTAVAASTAVGLVSWRQGGPPGSYKNATIEDNNVLWFAQQSGVPVQVNSWYTGTIDKNGNQTGSDGLTPNHGATVETDPAGTNPETNTDMLAVWGNGLGELLVKGRKHVLTQPAIGDGFEVFFASHACPNGDGIFAWNNTTKKISFSANGEGFGIAVPIITNIQIDRWWFWYDVISAGGQSIRVRVRADLLPNLDTSYYIKVTNHKITSKVQIYPGVTGKWTGTNRITGGLGTAPAIPTGVTASNNLSTGVSVTSPDYPITGAGSYRVYRDNVLIASPTALPYLDPVSGLTANQVYSYELASASTDTVPIISDRSSPAVSGSAVGAAADLLGGSFNTDFASSGWTAVDANPSITNGIVTIPNTAASAGRIYKEITGLTPGVPLNINFNQRGAYQLPDPESKAAHVVVTDSVAGSNGDWDSAATGWIATYELSNSSMTQSSSTFTPPAGVTSVFVILHTNAALIGDKTEFDEVTVTA